ncbi:flagellar protein FlgN [Bacillota bacterium LX-D]|nr:flagellar protein FlgN [Bacillota bacterium LX-D]
MDHNLDLLQTLMQKENEVVEELLNLAEQELEALKIDDLQSLTTITQKQHKICQELTGLEKERLQLQTVLSSTYNLQPNFSLTELIAAIPENQQLAALGQKLKRNYTSLKELNGINSLLIKQSLSLTNKILGALMPNRKPVVYGQSGTYENSIPKTIKLDKSV